MDENQDVEQLFKIRTYSEQTFDKQIVYLAGGGLILTIGFVKEIINIDEALCKGVLFVSWILFTLCLTFNLLSHKASTKAVDYYLIANKPKGDTWNGYINTANYLSTASLFLGIISFIIFVIKNINHG